MNADSQSVNKQSNKSTTSKLSNLSPTSSLLSSIMIDPRLIPKNLLKFTKTGTDDERVAMLERFRAEGIDPRKLNDSKKLLNVWRWLVDAEINCQSLRHQLEKMRIQHEQELQEVEDYVSNVWKLSMGRLSTLQEENQFLHSKLNYLNHDNHLMEIDGIYPSRHDFNNNNNFDDDDEGNNNEEENCSHDIRKYRQRNESLSSSSKLVTGLGPQQHSLMIPHSLSTSSLSPVSSCHSSNVIANTLFNNDGNAGIMKRSASFLGLHHTDSVTNRKEFDCIRCRKFVCELTKLKRQLNDVRQQLENSQEQNSVMKKLNRCIEIENENFAYKLSESESQCNQLEQRILILEQELKNQRTDSNSSSQIVPQVPKLEEQSLIEELNEKIKKLEEILDSKRTELEEAELKLSKQQQISPFLLFRNNDPNNQKLTLNYGSIDGFEEINLS